MAYLTFEPTTCKSLVSTSGTDPPRQAACELLRAFGSELLRARVAFVLDRNEVILCFFGGSAAILPEDGVPACPLADLRGTQSR